MPTTPRLDPAARESVWKAVCAIVYEHMRAGRAVRLPGLGCFCFDSREQFKGNFGWQRTQRPVLALSQQFLVQHGLKRESDRDEAGVKAGGAQPIFFEDVAARAGVSKDLARACVAA